MSRAVHPQVFSKVDVDHWYIPVWASHYVFCSSSLNTQDGTPKLILKTQTLPSSSILNGCGTPLSTSVQTLGVALDQTLYLATHILYMSGSVLSDTVPLTMLSEIFSVLPFRLVLNTVIHFSLGAPQFWCVNFKIMLSASSGVLPGLTTYLRPFILYTGILLNPVFSTRFFLPVNHWITKPLPVSRFGLAVRR